MDASDIATYHKHIQDVEVAICPFNESHMVVRKRLQYHIVKCAKTYKGNKVRCPYNAAEYIEPQDMKQHLDSCISRKLKEANNYMYQNHTRQYLSMTVNDENVAYPPCDENWGME